MSALDIICETSMGTKLNAQLQTTHPYAIAISGRFVVVVFFFFNCRQICKIFHFLSENVNFSTNYANISSF
jgi:cytochrome oxidase Cu insertion factor (SCO1/SenC/PrrC family)